MHWKRWSRHGDPSVSLLRRIADKGDEEGIICLACEQLLSVECFYAHTGNRNGYTSVCRPCSRVKQAKHYRNRESGWKTHLIGAARQRAKAKDLPFDLTVDDFEIPEFCPILGLKLEVSDGRGAGANSATLDRMDPPLGYVPGNVWVISARANMMKSDANADELRRFAAWIDKTFPDLI